MGTPALTAVVAHLVADAVRAPAERKLAEVAGAEHEAVVAAGEAEQIVGAEAGLDVLEGHVVHRLAARANGWPMFSSMVIAVGRMSISSASIPSACISFQAFDLVPSEVPKPGIV